MCAKDVAIDTNVERTLHSQDFEALRTSLDYKQNLYKKKTQ